jgi:hypothetical protein
VPTAADPTAIVSPTVIDVQEAGLPVTLTLWNIDSSWSCETATYFFGMSSAGQPEHQFDYMTASTYFPIVTASSGFVGS